MPKRFDFRVTGGSSVYMVEPLTSKAKVWVKEHVSVEGWQWLGKAFAVDHHYIGNLVDGIKGDGLSVV